ncbi:MAG: hypothetical protein IPG86_09865 [Chitinophagaceae bacterium]|nr:hypothetical protein [Chitinophagaceae bacterium]
MKKRRQTNSGENIDTSICPVIAGNSSSKLSTGSSKTRMMVTLSVV